MTRIFSIVFLVSLLIMVLTSCDKLMAQTTNSSNENNEAKIKVSNSENSPAKGIILHYGINLQRNDPRNLKAVFANKSLQVQNEVKLEASPKFRDNGLEPTTVTLNGFETYHFESTDVPSLKKIFQDANFEGESNKFHGYSSFNYGKSKNNQYLVMNQRIGIDGVGISGVTDLTDIFVYDEQGRQIFYNGNIKQGLENPSISDNGKYVGLNAGGPTESEMIDNRVVLFKIDTQEVWYEFNFKEKYVSRTVGIGNNLYFILKSNVSNYIILDLINEVAYLRVLSKEEQSLISKISDEGIWLSNGKMLSCQNDFAEISFSELEKYVKN